MTQEKRRIPRLTLSEPLEATISECSVGLLDLSNGGARVEHEFPMKTGVKATLEFTYHGTPVRVSCVLVRTRLGRSVMKPGSFAYSTGLRFSDPTESSRETVRQIVATMSRER